jgi:hypothetical protein
MADKNTRRNEAASSLKIVTPDKAFNFYRDIGQPLGVSSRSLAEFAAAVKGIDPSSIRFHVERGDFESWFRMLGDKSLAGQVAELRGKSIPPVELRTRLNSMVRTRIDQLQKMTVSK